MSCAAGERAPGRSMRAATRFVLKEAAVLSGTMLLSQLLTPGLQLRHSRTGSRRAETVVTR